MIKQLLIKYSSDLFIASTVFTSFIILMVPAYYEHHKTWQLNYKKQELEYKKKELEYKQFELEMGKNNIFNKKNWNKIYLMY